MRFANLGGIKEKLESIGGPRAAAAALRDNPNVYGGVTGLAGAAAGFGAGSIVDADNTEEYAAQLVEVIENEELPGNVREAALAELRQLMGAQ